MFNQFLWFGKENCIQKKVFASFIIIEGIIIISRYESPSKVWSKIFITEEGIEILICEEHF